MTTHRSRRIVLTFATLLVAGTTLGAPIALAASPKHAPIVHHRADARIHATGGAIAPQSGARQFDNFAALPLD